MPGNCYKYRELRSGPFVTDSRLLLTQEEEEGGGSVLCAWGGKGACLCLRLTAEGCARPPSTEEGGGSEIYTVLNEGKRIALALATLL